MKASPKYWGKNASYSGLLLPISILNKPQQIWVILFNTEVPYKFRAIHEQPNNQEKYYIVFLIGKCLYYVVSWVCEFKV